MNVITRGIRNAFRNKIRTFSIVVIVGLSIGLTLTMLVARQAVADKITSVKTSVGNTVGVSPAGARGFEGGGTPLTSVQAGKLATIAHVTAVSQTLSDRLTSSNTNLQSAVEAGTLGRRNSQNNGTDFSGGQLQRPPENTNPAGGQRTGTMGNGSATSVTPVERTFTPPVTVIGTDSPAALADNTTRTLKAGSWFAAGSGDTVAVVGSALATKNNLKTGSTFTAYGKTITVSGVFDAGSTFANNQVVMPLKTVQTLAGLSDQLNAITLTVDSVDNVAAVATAAKTSLGDAADVTNNAEQAASSVAPLENIRTITLYSLLGAMAAGAVIILLTMVMIVRERRREIGVIKAIGASNVAVMTQFASEAVTFTILGAVIGTVMGVFAANPITKLLVTNASSTSTVGQPMGPGGMGGPGGRALGGITRNLANVTASVGWEIIVYGLGVAILIAIVGSALASFFIAKVRPAEVMRAE